MMIFVNKLRLGCLSIIFLLLASQGNSQSQKRFTLLNPSQTGISFENTIKDSRESNILMYANFYGGAGVGIGDFNNDGLQDIYFAGNQVGDKLYLNQGNFVFKDVTKSSGIIDDGGWSTGVTVADVNNDGYLDIYVSRELYDDKPELRANQLYMNKGDGTFVESAKEYGVADTQRTRGATFLDYDKDGFLDLFLLTQPPNPGSYSVHFGEKLLKPEYRLRLLKNTGKNSFVDVTDSAGVGLTGFPNAVSASDLNNDGWTDIYVSNDFQAPDFMFMNNGDGTFTNVMDTAMNHISYYSMGVDVADIDNDALLDVFVMDMAAEDNYRLKSNMSGMNPKAFWKVVADGGNYQYMYNTLQRNNGNTTFSDVAQLAGVATTDWSWSNLIADLDNDGLKDIYVTNGLLYDIRNTDADKHIAKFINDLTYKWVLDHPDGGNLKSIWDILDIDKVVAMLPSQPLENYAYKNEGRLKFKKAMGDWGLDKKSFSNGAAYADLDNDGDLDIVVNNINEKAFIYRNNSEKKADANFLQVKLDDARHLPTFGSRVTIYSGNGLQMQETTNVRGTYSTCGPLVHFGLGNKTKVDSLVVVWPDQTKTVKRNVSANQTLKLSMDKASGLQKMPYKEWKNLFFTDGTDSFGIQSKHRENDFDDYGYQVLLPHKLSQFGPALATGDINNDGLDDVYIGGARGFGGALYVQNRNGGFYKSNEGLWQNEKKYEDVDALFVDINGDGYQDLYVVSGGNQFADGDQHYMDRIYLNDGKGNFSKGVISNMGSNSGSNVIAADYDGDGDMDLFVGGRHVPHKYPMPATSMLLQNRDGKLVNVTDSLAPGLKDIGMVTDASWADIDGDGDKDLVLVGEWMPITFFENDGGTLKKAAIDGMENTTGWWSSIEKGDFDHDGDMDFIVGNLGLNCKYKTSRETPFDVYYKDFDHNGSKDIVLGYYNGDEHYPVRGFSCSSQQIPGLKDKIKKYDVFAAMDINQIYGSKNLKKSLHYKADTFASSYMENLGNGHFKLSPLPYQAQFSTINDIMVDDFNRDGNLDALVVGNLFVTEIETPRSDAGTGLLLLGDGKGDFSPFESKESGFFAHGDAKKLGIVSNKGKRMVLVGNNNGALQAFVLHDEPNLVGIHEPPK